jgi:hypothetical protein
MPPGGNAEVWPFSRHRDEMVRESSNYFFATGWL